MSIDDGDLQLVVHERARRQLQADDSNDQAVLSHITVSAAEGDCAICLDKLRQPRTLPCGHIFCATCLESLHQHNGTQTVDGSAVSTRCPLCRGALSAPVTVSDAAPLQPSSHLSSSGDVESVAAPRAVPAPFRRAQLLVVLLVPLTLGIVSWSLPILIMTLPPHVRLEPGVQAIVYFQWRCWNKSSVEVHRYDGYGQQTNQYHGCTPYAASGKGEVTMVALLVALPVFAATLVASVFKWRRHCLAVISALYGVMLACACVMVVLYVVDHRKRYAASWGLHFGHAAWTLAAGGAAAFIGTFVVVRFG